jgi:D-amino-acid oxidase
VIFKRATLSHISDAGYLFGPPTPFNVTTEESKHSSKADIIINCTGLSSYSLGGVCDKALTPARGQIVLVRQELPFMFAANGVPDSEHAGSFPSASANGDQQLEREPKQGENKANEKGDELVYVMTRACGGGTVLGGCYQKGNWDANVDAALAERIMKRAVAVCPELVGKTPSTLQPESDWRLLDIVRHGVGLRPVREGGTRIEKEEISSSSSSDTASDLSSPWKGWVVHNYGHGGYGYQASYGCAEVVLKLVAECVELGKGVRIV